MRASARDKSFIDTNILVYTFDVSAPAKQAKARAIVSDALERRRSVISYQVVQEFLNVATRKFSPPMTSTEATLYLTRVLMPLCDVFPGHDLYSDALVVSGTAGISFYDALVVCSALAAGCKFVLTEDMQHGRRIRDVEIKNPFR